MHKFLLGLASAAVITKPAIAQDHRKNFNECARELGLYLDNSYTHRLQPDAGGRVLRRWYFHSEAQRMAFDSCLVRKASLASNTASISD
jgi:hypothetical protein